MTTQIKPTVAKRSVIHTFTTEETAQLHVKFRQAFANKNAKETQFDAVKTQFKAQITQCESDMETLNAQLQAGFENREKECWVRLRPADKKKDFYVVPGLDDAGRKKLTDFAAEEKMDELSFWLFQNPDYKPALTEEMLPEDFEQELLQAEAGFEDRRELVIWQADQDVGRIIIGRIGKSWYSAVRGRVGGHKVEERLDSEQKSFRKRSDAVDKAGVRAMKWLEHELGKENSKGFEQGIVDVVAAETDKVE